MSVANCFGPATRTTNAAIVLAYESGLIRPGESEGQVAAVPLVDLAVIVGASLGVPQLRQPGEDGDDRHEE